MSDLRTEGKVGRTWWCRGALLQVPLGAAGLGTDPWAPGGFVPGSFGGHPGKGCREALGETGASGWQAEYGREGLLGGGQQSPRDMRARRKGKVPERRAGWALRTERVSGGGNAGDRCWAEGREALSPACHAPPWHLHEQVALQALFRTWALTLKTDGYEPLPLTSNWWILSKPLGFSVSTSG